jgi:hypothetical protein
VASEDDPFADASWDATTPDLPGAGTQRKKERQRNTWVEKVLPTLIQPYLMLLHASNDFQSVNHVVECEECTCLDPHATLMILCVYFQCKLFWQCPWEQAD